MPNYRDSFPSKWLKASDCHPSLIVTIKSADHEDVGTGSDIQRKLVLHFVECTQGFVLNVTNANLIASLLGTDDTDDWVGAKICLVSTKVSFKDKLVDAIRVQPVPVRKSRPPVTHKSTPSPAPAPHEEDELEDVGF